MKTKAFVIALVAIVCCGVASANAQRAHAMSSGMGHTAIAHGTGSWHGGSATGGNWNRGNWSGGNWNHYHHHHYSNVYFDAGFGYPFWGWPYSDYGYYPYGYGYYPYGYGYGYGYDQPVVQGEYAAGYGNRSGSLVAQVQQRLARLGYYHGSIDGVAGSGTRRAVRAYERSHGLPVDGVIDPQLLATMGLSYARR